MADSFRHCVSRFDQSLVVLREDAQLKERVPELQHDVVGYAPPIRRPPLIVIGRETVPKPVVFAPIERPG